MINQYSGSTTDFALPVMRRGGLDRGLTLEEGGSLQTRTRVPDSIDTQSITTGGCYLPPGEGFPGSGGCFPGETGNPFMRMMMAIFQFIFSRMFGFGNGFGTGFGNDPIIPLSGGTDRGQPICGQGGGGIHCGTGIERYNGPIMY